ncbi:hypothetical protein ARW15_14730 [Listeria monocytogenes]|nr:hypothetical protein [Listeria monocytogenes]EAD4869120.1 hypothetical protein [Listeria monocytogenes]EAE1331073.1 hypothetical protein [Listeria monocytogenes]
MKNKFVIWWGRSSLILILFGIIMTGIFIAIKGQEYAPEHYTASFSNIFPWAIFLFGGIISCVVFVIYAYFSKDSIQQQEPTKIITSMNGKYKAEIYKKRKIAIMLNITRYGTAVVMDGLLRVLLFMIH